MFMSWIAAPVHRPGSMRRISLHVILGAQIRKKLHCSESVIFSVLVVECAKFPVLRSGINVLYSTTTAETFLASRLSRLCLESRALYAACIALQASFSEEVSFIEYFDTALATFRLELNGCGGVLHDGTWNAGLLLCAISVRAILNNAF